MADLSQARVLILAADGFERDELFLPRQALLDAGARVTLASIGTDPIRGVVHDAPADDTITPDLKLDDVDTEEFDCLLLPGGVANPDKLRMEERAVEIVQEFMDDDKLVAAICHAPWLLAEADVVDGRRLTSWPSIRTDLENAGADVVDEEVVVDGNLVTSRKPADIPAFNRAIAQALAAELEGVGACAGRGGGGGGRVAGAAAARPAGWAAPPPRPGQAARTGGTTRGKRRPPPPGRA